MPCKISGILYYTKAEIDQFFTAGFVASLANRNATIVAVASASWNLQSGGNFDGWYYADVVHPSSPLAYIAAFTGADAYINVCSGINDFQQQQNTTTVRIWLKEAPSYYISCLVVYA